MLSSIKEMWAKLGVGMWAMEQHTLKNVNSCRNTKITFYFETSSGQSSNLYLNADYFFNASVD
jgi:hypothetical protein